MKRDSSSLEETGDIPPGSKGRSRMELDRPISTEDTPSEIGECSVSGHPLAREYIPQPTVTRFLLPVPKQSAFHALVQEVLRSGSIYHEMQKTNQKPNQKTMFDKSVGSGDGVPSKNTTPYYKLKVVKRTKMTRKMGVYPVHPFAVAVGSQSGVPLVPWTQQGSYEINYHWQQVGGVLTETSVQRSENTVGEEDKEQQQQQRFKCTTKTMTTTMKHRFDE
eukprot:g5234.t1